MNHKAFCLYMDNAIVHRMNIIKDFCRENRITRVMNIAYCPDFNPIEATFSQVKRIFNKARLSALAREKEFDMIANIKKAFKVITPRLVERCAARSLALLKEAKL